MKRITSGIMVASSMGTRRLMLRNANKHASTVCQAPTPSRPAPFVARKTSTSRCSMVEMAFSTAPTPSMVQQSLRMSDTSKLHTNDTCEHANGTV